MHSLVKSVGNWGHQIMFPGQNTMCEICGHRPKFVENGFQHPYCSRRCARSATGTNPTACVLRGCRVTGRAAFAGFCSEVHGIEAVRCGQVQGCSRCSVQPKINGELCSTCDYRFRALESRMKELDRDEVAFKSVENHFLSEWQSSDGPAVVDKVYEISIPRDVRTSQSIFRKRLLSAGPVQEKCTYHSSQCICDLGTNGPVTCNHGSCGICSIVKSSFKEFAFGAPFNTGRYGAGIYSYQNPAIADHFATSCTSSPYRVMIACSTIVEPAAPKSSTTNPFIEGPIFVASADAITPTYIILYHK